MARGAIGNTDADGDLASGMGFAIGAVIALFAVAIALVVGLDQPRAAPAGQRDGGDGTRPRSTSLTTSVTPTSLPSDRR